MTFISVALLIFGFFLVWFDTRVGRKLMQMTKVQLAALLLVLWISLSNLIKVDRM